MRHSTLQLYLKTSFQADGKVVSYYTFTFMTFTNEGQHKVSYESRSA